MNNHLSSEISGHIVYIFVYLIIILCFVLIYSHNLNRTLFRPAKLSRDQIILGDGYTSISLSDKGCNLSAIHMSKYHSKTILFLHGRYGNARNYRNIFKLFTKIRMNVLFLDYRGYGVSGGYPSIKTIIQDSMLGYKYLDNMVGSENIIVWGESMGSIPAIRICSSLYSNIGCAGLVIFSGFSCVDDVMSYSKSYKSRMLGTFMKNSVVPRENLNNYRIIRNVRCPVMIVHSIDDDKIPIGCARKLFKHIGHNDKKIEIITGDHDKPDLSQDNLNSILEFVGSDIEIDIDRIQRYLRISHDYSPLILGE